MLATTISTKYKSYVMKMDIKTVRVSPLKKQACTDHPSPTPAIVPILLCSYCPERDAAFVRRLR